MHIAQQDAQHDRNHEGEEAALVKLEQPAVVSLDLGGVRGLEVCALFRHVHLQDARNQLHEQHHADHAEGIGDGIAGGGQIRKLPRRLLRRSQAGRAGERAGEQAHGQLRADAADQRDQHRADSAGQDDEKAQQDVARGVALEVAEELRPGDEAHRADEQCKAEISDDGGNLHAEMAEYQGNQQHAGRAQFNSLDANAADEVTQGSDQEHCEQRIHEPAPPISSL